MNDKDEFKYYQQLDSIGYDLYYVGPKSIKELKDICRNDKKCIGFNTLGYMKYYINDKLVSASAFKKMDDGLYVHMDRYFENIKMVNDKSYVCFDNYIYYPMKDSPDYDIQYVNKSVKELKELCDKDANCVGFNTLGFLKKKILPEGQMIDLKTNIYSQGLYVKKNIFRIKMICNWCTSKQLCHEWNTLSKGNFRWNNIEITWEDHNIDFYVIINKPFKDEKYIPERTIVFQMEPWCNDDNQKWGVKTWGEWAVPDESKFLHVRTHKKYYNNCFWQLNLSYNDLKTMRFDKTKLFSTICSSKYFDPGHIKRIDFLKYIEEKNDDVVKIDIYNHDNLHNFKSYKGPHPKNNKQYGIAPYKYYFMPENNEEHNFLTEKIWEPLLTETLCFYWGCPNISDYIDPRAYILLDLNDKEKSFNIIKNAILNNEWEKRLDVIRREKQKVLDYYSFFPTLERILIHDFKFEHNPSDEEVVYHKYFKDLIGQNVKNIGFIHSCTINNNTKILHEILDKINKSGCINSLDYLYIINIGNEISLNSTDCKIKLINYSNNIKLFEIPTINLIKTFSIFHKNTNILYLHTKGVSYNHTYVQQIDDWKNYMLFCLVEKYNNCLDLLNIYDCVGCNYMKKPFKHYSGNFWWTNSDYISKLSKITNSDRHSAEWWILSNDSANKYVIYNTQIDHYKSVYPRNLYENNVISKIMENYLWDNNLMIKCINLKRRNDRKIQILNSLESCKLDQHTDIFEAIDGTQLSLDPYILQMFNGNDFGNRRSFIGCALSHLTLWKQLISDLDYDRYLIIEDDITIDKSIKFKLNHINKKLTNYDNVDMLYLGYTYTTQNKNLYDEKVSKYSNLSIVEYDIKLSIGGFFGYIITKNGAHKLIDFIEKNGIKHGIDYIPIKYGKEIGLKQYEVVPQLIRTEYVSNNNKVDSDIQYDHTRLF